MTLFSEHQAWIDTLKSSDRTKACLEALIYLAEVKGIYQFRDVGVPAYPKMHLRDVFDGTEPYGFIPAIGHTLMYFRKVKGQRSIAGQEILSELFTPEQVSFKNDEWRVKLVSMRDYITASHLT